MPPELPTFAELRRRYTAADEDPPPATCARLPLEGRPEEPLARLVQDYLATLGLSARTLDQLFDAIEGLEDEELSAFRIVEGVAVTAASEGWWVLFTERGRA